jgi:2-octaprenyl-3-methyl-6-methoxy-1,4-benzoquinol hydroxylase
MVKLNCLVVGGGMVGAACALALAELGLTVGVVEIKQPEPFSSEQSYDLRVSAISPASEQLLIELGAWSQVLSWRACKYRRLAVWEQDQSRVEFSADDITTDHLGYIIENRLIQLALWQQLVKHPNVQLFCPNNILSISLPVHERVCVTLSDQTQIETQLVIAADGGNSPTRQLAGIGVTGWQYSQAAMLIHVETTYEQQDITWQQFMPSGPKAFLPLAGKNASLVWYDRREKIEQLAALTNEQLTLKIKQNFPECLGPVRVINSGSFPLARQHANCYIQPHIVLLGDAAHTINPLAGQGVNLGFKDVTKLRSVIAQALQTNRNWWQTSVLADYERVRRRDNQIMMTAMDSLYWGFSNENNLLKQGRNQVFRMINQCRPLKKHALKYACGLA